MQQKFKVAFLGIAVLSIGLIVLVAANSISNNSNLSGKDALADEVANEIASLELQDGVIVNYNKFGWEIDSDNSVDFARLNNLQVDSQLTVNIDELTSTQTLSDVASTEVGALQKFSDEFTLTELKAVNSGENTYYRIVYTDKDFGIEKASNTIKYIGIRGTKKITITYVYLESEIEAINSIEDIASKLVF